VTITATATGFVSGIDTLSVLDDDVPALSLSIAQTSISENGGISLASVSRNSNAGNPLTLNLLSSDTSEAIVSATVTIAAGQTNSAFLINAVNDNELDGTQTVTITASATGFAAVDGTIAVTDDDTGGVGAIQLTLTIAPASISENGGTATATVTRTGATVAALTVNLVSNDPGEATVPASVEIAAGETSATATVTAVDDAIADGIQTVTITASATGASDVNASVNVTDDEGGTTPDAIFSNDFED
jgi:hypothetical protein